MQLTIDGHSIDFQIKSGAELLLINAKKTRGKADDDYTSENYSLPEFVSKSAPTKVILFGQFANITAFESALHYFYSIATIYPGAKTFVFSGDINTSFNLSLEGAIPGGVSVDTKRSGSTISATLTFKIVNNYSA